MKLLITNVNLIIYRYAGCLKVVEGLYNIASLESVSFTNNRRLRGALCILSDSEAPNIELRRRQKHAIHAPRTRKHNNSQISLFHLSRELETIQLF